MPLHIDGSHRRYNPLLDHELIELWTVGSLLVGVMALPAGWLGDRWSAPGMLVVFFIGLGAAACLCGVSDSPREMWIGLCLLGAFAAIYHPVGVAWLVRNSLQSRGKALGINGIFGSAGVAGAGLVAGSLIDLFGWRTAYSSCRAVSRSQPAWPCCIACTPGGSPTMRRPGRRTAAAFTPVSSERLSSCLENPVRFRDEWPRSQDTAPSR